MEDIFSEIWTSQNAKRKRFTVEENKILAKKVKDRPEIWNLQHKLHSNSSAITSAWECISKEINKSVEECKTAWKSLKDGKRYRAKKVKSGSAADLELAEETPGPDWEYSDCMSFLATAASKRRTISSSAPIDLGVVLDKKLNFNLHYDNITARANKLLGFIKRRAKEFGNVWVTKTLFCTLVRPILEYACPIWDPIFQVSSSRIESVQKRFLLFALRNLYDPHDYQSLPHYLDRLKLLELMPLSSRRKLLISCVAFDALSGKLKVQFLSDKIKLNDEVCFD